MKNLLFTIFTVMIFVIGIGGLFAIQARGSGDYFAEDDKALEQQYIKEIRAVLSEYGMGNSGVTLTKTSEDGSFTEMTVEIHTGRTNDADMIARIRDIDPKIADCEARVVFP